MLPAAHENLIPLGVAPMEGVTGFAMRAFLYLASGTQALATPFLRVTATYPHRQLPRDFAPELTELKDVIPYELIPQLMAVESDDFLRATEFFPHATPFIELNCGCPSPTCVGKGAGSSLLRTADEFQDTVSTLAKALGPGRLAVKMRLGFAAADEFPALLAGIEKLALARLTIHGRTRPAGYKGQADWTWFALAAARATAPVYASGDIVDRQSFAAKLALAPAVKGAIIGRGVLRNPWIFQELTTGEAQDISPEALVLAVGSQALLQELALSQLSDLYALVKEGLLAEPCGTDAGRWRRVHDRLAQTLAGKDPLTVSRPILGRAKMLWSYLRSSLPPSCFEPRVLRAKSLDELLSGIRTVARDAGETLPLRHRGDLDWLYAGEGRKQEARPGGEQSQDERREQGV